MRCKMVKSTLGWIESEHEMSCVSPLWRRAEGTKNGLPAVGTSPRSRIPGSRLDGSLRSSVCREVAMDLFSFIDCANRTQSLSALFDLLVESAAEEGFGEVAYGALNYEEPVRLPDHPMPAIAVNFPLHWRKHYFEHKYQEI